MEIKKALCLVIVLVIIIPIFQRDIDTIPLTGDEAQSLDSFIEELANGLNLYTGPLNFQDGTVYVESGKSLDWAGDQLSENPGVDAAKVWYTPQLLEGIEGSSE